jgi:hypothetical protein
LATAKKANENLDKAFKELEAQLLMVNDTNKELQQEKLTC